jgi:hypothetical protein
VWKSRVQWKATSWTIKRDLKKENFQFDQKERYILKPYLLRKPLRRPLCFYEKLQRFLWSKLLAYAILMAVIKASISVHRIKWRRQWWPNIPTHSRNQWTGICHKAEHFLHVVQLARNTTLHSEIGSDIQVTSSRLKHHWATYSLLTSHKQVPRIFISEEMFPIFTRQIPRPNLDILAVGFCSSSSKILVCCHHKSNEPLQIATVTVVKLL